MKLPKFEHLYCGFTLDLTYRHKWGISISADQRWMSIKQDLELELGREIKVYKIALPILFARQFEQGIFRLFKSFRYTGLKRSTGRTEYFWSINFISFFLAWFLMWKFGVDEPKWKALFLLLIPAPIDGFLVVSTIFIVQWAAIVGLFGLGFYYLIF